jgi:LysR family transcriptional regulator, transcriptional activator of nhaA
MEWLNYHHLLYFWTVARTGSVTAASLELKLSPATISAQIHDLESSLGERLVRRSGRNLVLTETGAMVFRYSSEIFALGRELMSAVRDGPRSGPLRLVIGVADVVPSLIAQWLIEPAMQLPQPVRITCREAAAEQLLAKLAIQEIDLVLSDAPLSSTLNIRAYNHLLGECGITFVGSAKLAEECKKHFPHSLNGAPMLLPTDNTSIRRGLDQWFQSQDIHPKAIGEFEDYSLLRAFGEAGLGILPAPAVLEKRIERIFKLRKIGRTDAVHHRFFVISADRKINHPAVAAIMEGARHNIFQVD